MAKNETYVFVDAECPLEAFQGVAYSMLLQPTGPGTGIRGDNYRERWSNKDIVVEWLEVGKLECNFVRFISPDPKSTAEYLADKLGGKVLSQLLDLAADPGVEHNDLVYLLYYIAYMSPELTAEVQTQFERTMQDPRPTIRCAALNGYMIRRWPPLWERLVNIEATDPDEDVRATAREVVKLGPVTQRED